MKNAWKFLAAFWVMSALSCTAGARDNRKTKSGFLTTLDGVRIHYLEARAAKTTGSFASGGTRPAKVATAGQVFLNHLRRQPSILFVPGWMMPAWIWEKQLGHFAREYRVVAMDPRGQGEPLQTADGL
jgi:pimeloyl-ACP methyl ester carboxylesterase